jgi:hypothetical protein
VTQPLPVHGDLTGDSALHGSRCESSLSMSELSLSPSLSFSVLLCLSVCLLRLLKAKNSASGGLTAVRLLSWFCSVSPCFKCDAQF